MDMHLEMFLSRLLNVQSLLLFPSHTDTVCARTQTHTENNLELSGFLLKL